MNIYYIIHSLVIFYYNILTKSFLNWFFNNLKLDLVSIENIRLRIFILKSNEYFFIILLFLIIMFSPFIFSIWILHHLYISGIHIIKDYIFNFEIKNFIKFSWTLILISIIINNFGKVFELQKHLNEWSWWG